MNDKERDSIRALVEESKETEEITRKLANYLKRDHKSVERMRAVRTGIGSIESLAPPLLPPEKPKE